uniref:UGSC family (seleno)protein n=1 Tax=Rhodococcus wratislaviensis TaxID=44752 RepID=UPI003F81BC18
MRTTPFRGTLSFSSDASAEVINRIAAENDIALTAIGDCGSCCSACVTDGVRLEQAGLPTAVIVTTEFEHEARLQRDARGMADLEPVVITHPISSLTLEQLEGRAAEVAPQALDIWLTGTPTRATRTATTSSV